jgi:hypothetical protein
MSDWLRDIYPQQAVQLAMAVTGVRECVQRAGETVFVPAGWHHGVVNIGVGETPTHLACLASRSGEGDFDWPGAGDTGETVALALQKSGPGGPFEGAAATSQGAQDASAVV